MLHRQSEQIPPLMPTSSEETASTTKPPETTTSAPLAAATAILSAPTQPTPTAQPSQPKVYTTVQPIRPTQWLICIIQTYLMSL